MRHCDNIGPALGSTLHQLETTTSDCLGYLAYKAPAARANIRCRPMSTHDSDSLLYHPEESEHDKFTQEKNIENV